MNRFTDLNNSANFSANKTAQNALSGLSSATANGDPFRSVDVLGRKRRQFNLSKTHTMLQEHLDRWDGHYIDELTLEERSEEEENSVPICCDTNTTDKDKFEST